MYFTNDSHGNWEKKKSALIKRERIGYQNRSTRSHSLTLNCTEWKENDNDIYRRDRFLDFIKLYFINEYDDQHGTVKCMRKHNMYVSMMVSLSLACSRSFIGIEHKFKSRLHEIEFESQCDTERDRVGGRLPQIFGYLWKLIFVNELKQKKRRLIKKLIIACVFAVGSVHINEWMSFFSRYSCFCSFTALEMISHAIIVYSFSLPFNTFIYTSSLKSFSNAFRATIAKFIQKRGVSIFFTTLDSTIGLRQMPSILRAYGGKKSI